MVTSEQTNEVATALAKAQGAMHPAIKDANNPAFRSKYADLTSVWEACREPLTKHGLSVLQDVTTTPEGIQVTTRIAHSSGQWIELGPLTVPLDKPTAHGVGSATSYARRYALSAAVGVVADDDDGNAASERNTVAAKKAEPPKGYDDWLVDLTSVADNGAAALKEAWAKSALSHRGYLTLTNSTWWEQLKAKASAVKVTA